MRVFQILSILNRVFQIEYLESHRTETVMKPVLVESVQQEDQEDHEDKGQSVPYQFMALHLVFLGN